MNSLGTYGDPKDWKNIDLLIPYAAPYFAYVALVSILHNKIADNTIYILQLVIVPALLIWAWRWYVPFTGPKNSWISCFWGFVVGVIGLVTWVGLFLPFSTPVEGEPWSPLGLGLRIATAGFVVPVFEEVFMRGFVLRLALQWDLLRKQGVAKPFWKAMDESNIARVEPGQWTPCAVGISTVIFAAGHLMAEWPAAIVYGLLMAFLWIWRKDLISCIIAHATTNIGLALYVYYSGHLELW